MKNKISILLVLFSHLTIAQKESEEFTYFKINRESQELGGLIKCFEVGSYEQKNEQHNEIFSPFFWNHRLELLKNKDRMTVQTSAPIGSEHRFCSRNVEAIRNWITLLYDEEQALFNQLGFKLRSGTLCAFSNNDDSNIILTVNKRNNQIESKKSVVIQDEKVAIVLPCKVIAVVVHDNNVSNAELGYRASNMLQSGEGAEYHCEKFSMKLTHLTEENNNNTTTYVHEFFPNSKSK